MGPQCSSYYHPRQLDRVSKFLVDDTHYRNRFETGTSGGSTDIVARKSLEVRIWAMIKDWSSFILLEKEKNPTLSKQLEIIGVLEAMPERKNQGTSRVVEDDWFASGSNLEAFPRLFVSVHFFKISYSLFTFSDKFRREVAVSLVTLKFKNQSSTDDTVLPSRLK